MGPQYLIRFDDICPTMNWSVWGRVEEILLASGVKPILAVVPDNQDEKLKVDQPNVRFWEDVRRWQSQGWTIGLHGYQHRYVTQNSGLLGIKTSSEFSGLPVAEQQSKLRSALDIFEREHVAPEIWIAPAHSFDCGTLRSLSALGVRCLSDGFSLYPYLDSHGMLWVPQQLWHFRSMPLGLWTVCFHSNQWSAGDIDKFKLDVQRFAPRITDLRNVQAVYDHRKLSLTDQLFAGGYQMTLKGRQWIRSFNSAKGINLC